MSDKIPTQSGILLDLLLNKVKEEDELSLTEVKMPQLSMTMLEGRIVKWLKNEGDPVQEGEPLLEVESDKVVMEITAPASGYVRKILAAESEVIPVGSSICLIGEKEDKLPEEIEVEQKPTHGEMQTGVQCNTYSDIDQTQQQKSRISPAARRLAQELGVDIAKLKGTGPDGLIVKVDVEQASQRAKPTIYAFSGIPKNFEQTQKDATSESQQSQDIEILPLRGIRKQIAQHLTISKQNVADVTTVTEVDMTQVVSFRSYLPISYTAFVTRAAAVALRQFPILNSSLKGEEIYIMKRINICVAVATDAGLVTPVIHDADLKNVLTIADEINELARRARERTLMLEDLADGTFTVTNSGTYGSLFFTPIINYPQTGILGMGKVVKTPVVRKDKILIAPIMYLCLTYDHRVIDGAPAVQFVQRVKYYLENPQEIIHSKI